MSLSQELMWALLMVLESLASKLLVLTGARIFWCTGVVHGCPWCTNLPGARVYHIETHNISTTPMDSLDDDLDISALESSIHNKDNAPVNPTHHVIDEDAAQSYIYPKNLQRRDYQFNIVARALYHNVLVALPTGLGKTFIASTVMLNFLRWFPDSKIIFMAPTKPLVAQQIKACCSITGIPSLQTAILLDKTRRNRAEIWSSKSVFFTTPQVVENDLTAGIVHPKLVALLVIDEAHRARGNYAYNNVVKFLDRFTKSYRILALTATPAADVDGVQEVVDNLHISRVEVRTERSIDIFKYLKRKTIDRVTVGQTDDIKKCVLWLCDAITPVLETANQRGIYDVRDPAHINAFSALTSQQKIIKNPLIPEGLKWANYFILQLLVVVGQCMRRLNIYGLRSFYKYFSDKHNEFTTKYSNKKSTNHMAAKFYYHASVQCLLRFCEEKIADPDFIAHPKLDVVLSEVKEFFDHVATPSSRVIIFTEFRESALDIVTALERLLSAFKPHIFIGQAKEKDKFDEEKFLAKGKKKKKADSDDPPAKKSRKNPQSSSEEAQMNGMSQKMQKDLIKKFKQGVYNVLVATSIGEEGLDIGEVDLIVCYDSTSSPIKNIQRMGRTGRNRDGKVLLLFSSNEEQKFDKAMSGYEYIQQHIMNDNLIKLSPQNRMLPLQYQPHVEEKIIEIPGENIELKNEDDDDEIIRIATRHMNSSAASKGSVRGKKGTRKKEKLEKRFFMPDDVETGFLSVSSMLKLQSEKPASVKPENPPMEADNQDDLLGLMSVNNDPQLQAEGRNGSRQRTIDLVFSRQSEQPVKIGETGKTGETEIIGETGKTAETESVKPPSRNILGHHPVADDFDDDDDEILELARKSTSITYATSQSRDDLFPNTFAAEDGVLNEEQTNELYMAYYVPVNASDLIGCYDPIMNTYEHHDAISHSITSKRLRQALDYMQEDETNKDLIRRYEELNEEPMPPLKDFIDFE